MQEIYINKIGKGNVLMNLNMCLTCVHAFSYRGSLVEIAFADPTCDVGVQVTEWDPQSTHWMSLWNVR